MVSNLLVLLYAVLISSLVDHFVLNWKSPSFMFVSVDWIVERRQKMVMDKAVKSTAVVSSLFPEVVHDRLFNDTNIDEGKGKKNTKDAWKTSTVTHDTSVNKSLREMLGNNGTTRTSNSNSPGEESPSAATKRSSTGRPIADRFPHCTVFFAGKSYEGDGIIHGSQTGCCVTHSLHFVSYLFA